jgi:DUF1680 family protein
LVKGYLILPPDWVAANPSFTLDVDISPTLVSPHPYTNQDAIALARGPIVYCVEDVDNPWVKDHFKSVQLDPGCSVNEKSVVDDTTGDTYVALTVVKGANVLKTQDIHASPGIESKTLDEVARADDSVIQELKFVPYYIRANRGGHGQARVGLKRWHR